MYMGMTWNQYYRATTSCRHTGDIYSDVASMLRTSFGYDPILNRIEIQEDFGLSCEESERLIDAVYSDAE